MKIQIEPHNPYWKLYFQKEAARIQKLLTMANIRAKVAHIGSTAVPNLAAKPTIDILVGLDANAVLDDCIAAFQKANYIYVSKYNEYLPFRRFFIKIKPVSPLEKWEKQEITVDDEMPLRRHYRRDFHVHVVHEADLFFKRHLDFVQHLKNNDADRAAYERLKLHLANLDWQGENEYAGAKAPFITNIMAKLGYA